jgi:hypothetical protein
LSNRRGERLRCGTIRDLRSCELYEGHDDMVRTCVNAVEGLVEIDL